MARFGTCAAQLDPSIHQSRNDRGMNKSSRCRDAKWHIQFGPRRVDSMRSEWEPICYRDAAFSRRPILEAVTD